MPRWGGKRRPAGVRPPSCAIVHCGGPRRCRDTVGDRRRSKRAVPWKWCTDGCCFPVGVVDRHFRCRPATSYAAIWDTGMNKRKECLRWVTARAPKRWELVFRREDMLEKKDKINQSIQYMINRLIDWLVKSGVKNRSLNWSIDWLID